MHLQQLEDLATAASLFVTVKTGGRHLLPTYHRHREVFARFRRALSVPYAAATQVSRSETSGWLVHGHLLAFADARVAHAARSAGLKVGQCPISGDM